MGDYRAQIKRTDIFNSGRKGSDCPTTISESVRKKNI